MPGQKGLCVVVVFVWGHSLRGWLNMCQVVDLCFYNLGQASPLFRHHEGKLQTRYRNRHCLGRRAVNQNTAWKQINAVIVKAVEFGTLHTYMLYVRPARVSRKNDGARGICTVSPLVLFVIVGGARFGKHTMAVEIYFGMCTTTC